MANTSERIIILTALLLVVIFILSLNQFSNERIIETSTSNIIFRYGSSGVKQSNEPDTFTKHSNELDTFKGIFTKDMVNKDPAWTKMDLTPDELDTIYQKMVDIDFFSYPKNFHPKFEGSVIGSTDPFLAYYLEYQNETGTKVVYWDTQFVAPEDTQYKNLRELAHLIIEIIQAKPEYQDLPKPTSILEKEYAWIRATVLTVEPSPSLEILELSSEDKDIPRSLFKAIGKALPEDESVLEGEQIRDVPTGERRLTISIVDAESIVHYFGEEIEKDRLYYEYYVGYVDSNFSILIQFHLPDPTS